MYDIITFGSATQDIYFTSKKFLPVYGKKFITGEGVCLNLGSKTEIDSVFFFSGGGGTNTAATFAKQGFQSAYCGQVGLDSFGDSIIKELKKLKIDTSLVGRTSGRPTNMSVILTYPGKDRTILVYRGASDLLEKKDIPWNKLKNTKWFYLAPFSGKLAALTETFVDFAKKNKIKVAMNPGYKQLSLPLKTLERIFKKIDVLVLNREEASLITKIPYKKEKNIFKKLDQLVPGICVMTKGKEGSCASDGKYMYKASALPTKAIDMTGVGDSFSAGFISGFIKKNDIIFAMQLATANSSFNLRKIGAKEGLLLKNQSFPKVKVLREKLRNLD
ncbi:MAG: carbohydrate kinase family protein [Parcubacteria group bacterium]